MSNFTFDSFFQEMYGLLFGSPLSLPLTFVASAALIVYHIYISHKRELQPASHQGANNIPNAEIIERSSVNLSSNSSNYSPQSFELNSTTNQNRTTRTHEADIRLSRINRYLNDLQIPVLSKNERAVLREKQRKYNLKICSEKILSDNISVNLYENFEEKSCVKKNCAEVKVLNTESCKMDNAEVETSPKVLSADDEGQLQMPTAIMVSYKTQNDNDTNPDGNFAHCSTPNLGRNPEIYNTSLPSTSAYFHQVQINNFSCVKHKYHEMNDLKPPINSIRQENSSKYCLKSNDAAENSVYLSAPYEPTSSNVVCKTQNSIIDSQYSSNEQDDSYEIIDAQEINSFGDVYVSCGSVIQDKPVSDIKKQEHGSKSCKILDSTDVNVIHSEDYACFNATSSSRSGLQERDQMNPEITSQCGSNDQEYTYDAVNYKKVNSLLNQSSVGTVKEQLVPTDCTKEDEESSEYYHIPEAGIESIAYFDSVENLSLTSSRVLREVKINPDITSSNHFNNENQIHELGDVGQLSRFNQQNASSSSGAIPKREIKPVSPSKKQKQSCCQRGDIENYVEKGASYCTPNTVPFPKIEQSDSRIISPISSNQQELSYKGVYYTDPSCPNSSSSGAITKKKYSGAAKPRSKKEYKTNLARDQYKKQKVDLRIPIHIKKITISKLNASIQDVLNDSIKKISEIDSYIHWKKKRKAISYKNENPVSPISDVSNQESSSNAVYQDIDSYSIKLEQRLRKLEQKLRAPYNEANDEFINSHYIQDVNSEPIQDSNVLIILGNICQKSAKKLSKKFSEFKTNFVFPTSENAEYSAYENTENIAENIENLFHDTNSEAHSAEGGVQSYLPVSSPVFEQDLCIGCDEMFANSVYFPCGHSCLCLKCAQAVFPLYKKCCVCNENIDSVHQLGN